MTDYRAEVREVLSRTDPEIVRAIESPAAYLLRCNRNWLDVDEADIAQAARDLAELCRADEDVDPDSHTWVMENEKYIIRRAQEIAAGGVVFERECEEGERL